MQGFVFVDYKKNLQCYILRQAPSHAGVIPSFSGAMALCRGGGEGTHTPLPGDTRATPYLFFSVERHTCLI